MNETNIIEITTTFEGFGLGLILQLNWGEFVIYLGFISIVINYKQKKTPHNNWVNYAHNK